MSRSTDRHKTPRSHKSGYTKLKEQQEKQKCQTELLSKTYRMTDFFSTQVPDDTSQERENKDPGASKERTTEVSKTGNNFITINFF